MWVLITETLGDGRYRGKLNNTPFFLDMELGDPIEFEAKHITQIKTTQ